MCSVWLGTDCVADRILCDLADIACGGLVYLLVRFQPSIYQRYSRRQDVILQPLGTKHRILLEVAWCFGLCLIICPPMIQAPLADVLPLYFQYFRLPYSFLICTCTVAGVIQTSEPLPHWAIFSRVMTSKVMTTLGLISYSVYLNHWPLIVLFGSPVDHGKFENSGGGGQEFKTTKESTSAAEQVDHELLPDILLMIISLVVGYFSFVAYEIKIIRWGSGVLPCKVISFGFVSTILTAVIVAACFWNDLHSTHDANDDLTVYGLAAGNTTILFQTPAETAEYLIGSVNRSHSNTPVWILTGTCYHSFAYFTHDIDSSIVPEVTNEIRSCWAPRDGCARGIGECKRTTGLYSNMSRSIPRGSIVITCKTYSNISPCDYGYWKQDTVWVWLTSASICRKRNTILTRAHNKVCPEKLKIISVDMKAAPAKTTDGATGHTFTGRLYLDRIYLWEMLLAVEAKHPAVFSRRSVQHIQRAIDDARNKDTIDSQKVAKSGSSDLKLLVLGDSVAARIAGISKEVLEQNVHCLNDRPKRDFFPIPKIVSLAKGGQPLLQYFATCPTQNVSSAELAHRDKILTSIPAVKPEIVMIHDHFWSGRKQNRIDKIEDKCNSEIAMATFLKQAKIANVKQVYFLTSGVIENEKIERVSRQLTKIHRFVEAWKCKHHDDTGGISFTILPFHLLTCPDFELKRCQHDVHNFSSILPDGVHPSGKSGEWLCAQVLAALMNEWARIQFWNDRSFDQDDHVVWRHAVSNPISACLLEKYQPGRHHALETLIQRHLICPNGV
jgi:hypothetical protein